MLSNLLPKKLWISKYHISWLWKYLTCENYTLPSQKHDWVFIQFTRLRCVLVWKCYISCWSLQNTSTALPLTQPVLLPNNSTALFLAQMLDTSRWEKKPLHILPKALLFFDSAQHQSTNTRGGMSIHGCFRGTFFSKPGIYLVDPLSSQLLLCRSTPLQSRIKVWGSFPKVQPRDSSVTWNSHASHSNKAEGKAAKG